MAFSSGERRQLLAVGFFGVLALTKVHHFVKSIVHGAYFPGRVTAIPFVAVGMLLLRRVVREFWNAGSPDERA